LILARAAPPQDEDGASIELLGEFGDFLDGNLVLDLHLILWHRSKWLAAVRTKRQASKYKMQSEPRPRRPCSLLSLILVGATKQPNLSQINGE
jgi:hypothetical protein